MYEFCRYMRVELRGVCVIVLEYMPWIDAEWYATVQRIEHVKGKV